MLGHAQPPITTSSTGYTDGGSQTAAVDGRGGRPQNSHTHSHGREPQIPGRRQCQDHGARGTRLGGAGDMRGDPQRRTDKRKCSPPPAPACTATVGTSTWTVSRTG